MSHVCPLNNRACRCDPKATDKKFYPCALTKRIGTLVRLMGSNFDGEAIGAANGLRRLLPAEGLSFSDLAVMIENRDGRIEEEKYSDSHAEVIFARGAEKGREEEAQRQDLPPEFYDANGSPRWNEIALYCRKNLEHLKSNWEKEFITDMAGKTLYRQPSEKQAKHLLGIFVKLGGRYDPNKTPHLYR